MQISYQNSNCIQNDVVSLFTRQMKPHRFENDPLLVTVSNRHSFGNSLDRCRVNRRCNRTENDAVTNETAFVLTLSNFPDISPILGWLIPQSCDPIHINARIINNKD